MIVDGKALANTILQSLKNEVSHFSGTPHLTVIVCAPDFATQKYLTLKKQKAESVGIAINIIELANDATTADVVQVINRAAIQTDGIIVQLPLPATIDRTMVINAIPSSLDVDAMHYNGAQTGLLPPVVGAIAEIVQQHGIVIAGQKVVVVGDGLLVGKPAAIWAASHNANVVILTKDTTENDAQLATADIIITGTGVPSLITPENIKEGVIIFDAGTAEDNGELKGDVHPDCVKKASVFTPVPGGIGPLTVAILLRNVLASAR